jgi:hypothetical protein
LHRASPSPKAQSHCESLGCRTTNCRALVRRVRKRCCAQERRLESWVSSMSCSALKSVVDLISQASWREPLSHRTAFTRSVYCRRENKVRRAWVCHWCARASSKEGKVSGSMSKPISPLLMSRSSSNDDSLGESMTRTRLSGSRQHTVNTHRGIQDRCLQHDRWREIPFPFPVRRHLLE